MQEIKTLKELKQAIKKAKAVFVSACISKHDTSYIQVIKADILAEVSGWDEHTILSFCRVDEMNQLFID